MMLRPDVRQLVARSDRSSTTRAVFAQVVIGSALSLVSCKSSPRPDGVWDITQRTISSSCPKEHPADEESTETYVIRTQADRVTLQAEDESFAGTLRGATVRLEGPEGKDDEHLRAAIDLTFDGDALDGDARISTKGCEIETELSGVRTATTIPALRQKPTRTVVLPELPDTIRGELSPADYLGSWQALETVDGTPCGEDRYERRATLTLLETNKGLAVSASAPSAGFGAVSYSNLAVAIEGNTLRWTATFPSGGDQVRTDVTAQVAEDGRLIAKIRWTYSYQDEPDRTCSGPSVMIATRTNPAASSDPAAATAQQHTH